MLSSAFPATGAAFGAMGSPHPIGAVTGVRDRRFVAVDRECGIVFAFAFFD